MDCAAVPGHNQDTLLLFTHSTAVCHVWSCGSGLLELDLNYSFTGCHCGLGKQKTSDSGYANLVSSSSTFEVEEGEKEKLSLV